MSMSGFSIGSPFPGAAFTCSLWPALGFYSSHYREYSEISSRELFLFYGGKLRQSRTELNSMGQQVRAATKGPFLTLLGSWGLHSQRTLAPSPFVQLIPGLLSPIMK